MSTPTRSFAQMFRRGLAHFRTSFRGFPLGIKNFLGQTARAVVLVVFGLQKSVEDVDRNIVPSADSDDDTLTGFAELIGLPDGAGGLGRLVPTKASGGEATLTGVMGTIYPDGALATAEDGVTQVALSGAVTIPGVPPGFGSIAAKFVAVTAGSSGNLPVGAQLTWSSPPGGADGTFLLTEPLEGAIDLESNADVFARIVERLQDPPRGGVDTDYEFWAQVPGVFKTYVYPLRSGTGSVDLVICAAGSGTGRVPSGAVKTAVEAAIRSLRPVAASAVNVLLAITTTGHLVRVRVTVSSEKYAFDWIDSVGGPFTVDVGGYASGPPATLRLNTLAPASLKAAIDAYKAAPTSVLAPRLQVLSTGSVINPPIHAVDYLDGGGKTTLTLESVPADWTAPSNGNSVYAYGPVVATIAAGILALCDSLGPSTISGFGDQIRPWLDTLTIAGIIAVAENANDTDGTRLISNAPVGQTTIDGSAADVRGSDNSSAPELLFLSHVAVTQ